VRIAGLDKVQAAKIRSRCLNKAMLTVKVSFNPLLNRELTTTHPKREIVIAVGINSAAFLTVHDYIILLRELECKTFLFAQSKECVCRVMSNPLAV
jgi:hypothetical protein